MYDNIRKNLDKNKHFFIFGLIVFFVLVLAIAYQSEKKVIKKTERLIDFQIDSELNIFKKFLISKINSPFTNINYEIKNGDTIQKILKKYKVKNNEIQKVINQYKKYGNPNQLLVKNRIDIII